MYTSDIQGFSHFKKTFFELLNFEVKKSDFRPLPFPGLWSLWVAFFGVGPLLTIKSTCPQHSKMVSWASVDDSRPILQPFEVKK